MHMSLWDPVKREQHVVRLDLVEHRSPDGLERLHEGRVRIEGGDDGDKGGVPTLLHLTIHGLDDGARGARCVLGIQRADHDVVAALRLKLREAGGDGRGAVAHGQHHRPLREQLVDHRLEPLAMDEQRGALICPDLLVRLRGFGRSERADDQVHEGPPDRRGHVDHAAVHEELPEVSTHFGGTRRVGGAEVDEEDAGLVAVRHG